MDMKLFTSAGACALIFAGLALCQDPRWPREITKNGTTLTIYHPQVDSWKDFKELDWRMAISLTPAGGKPAVGIAVLHAHTEANPENDAVQLTNITLKSTTFPSLDPAAAAQMDQLARQFVPPALSTSMRRLIACVPKPDTAPTVSVLNDAPPIYVSYAPAILLYIDGAPQYAAISGTKLEFVVNTAWPLFRDTEKPQYYLLAGKQWMTASGLQGPWTPAAHLPRDMDRLPNDSEWASLRSVIPPPATANPIIPAVFYTTVPSEIILFNGAPVYSKIPGTALTYATNTDSNVFLYGPTRTYYYLTAGRWFSSTNLNGPWTYATPNLPADFAMIPPSSPAGGVLSAVPGTEEAKDAVLLAQVPTTLVVNPATAAAQVKVQYSGPPTFAPIEGTSMSYATNTADKIIQVGNQYYLCLQGIWFTSASPQGPWTTATSVPQVIYTIPPSSPVYNVTYVTQNVTPEGNVQANYTAGYLGGFITGTALGAILASGTGYYYPPYIGYPGGYPVYHPYAATYGAPYTTARGAYGISQTVSGPYGSATRAAQYNPYTGTMARGASVSTPYGSRSAAQAYNPYTGAYAATRQGSSPGAQWGSSVATKGGQTAWTQHYSTPQRTTASAETSAGGKAAGTTSAHGDTVGGKTSSGDMYAGHDGNVYKNTGSGWEKYNNGSWNSVNKPSSSEGGQRSTGAMNASPSASGLRADSGSSAHAGSAPEGLNQEFQNRQRGAMESDRFSQSRSGGFGGEHSGGGGHFGGFHGRR